MAYSCTNCKKRDTCTEICQKIKKYLQRKKINKKYYSKGYSARWVRRQEIPFSNDRIEQIHAKTLRKNAPKRKKSS